MNENQKDKFISNILSSALKDETLKELFESKLNQLQISTTSALEILGMSSRTLKGILEGTQKIFDHTALIKIASLLQEPREKVVKLYFDSLEERHPIISTTTPEKIEFIKANFPLAILKKDKFINNITDFDHIEKRICSRLGLKSIFEYRRPQMDVAFSSGNLFKPQNELTRSFWIAAAKACFEEIDNPYKFDQQALADYFPKLRWQSTDVEHGFYNVIRHLYKLGVTVIYQPPLHTLQLRGATFSVNDKPCIVITNYVGFYSTLWFALIHEILHVIFDWGEIKANAYHLSDDSNPDLSVKEKEAETNKYARQYLFSQDKAKKIKPFLNDITYVKEFAIDNHVHESLIYAFNAFDTGNNDRMAWARARRYDGDIKECIKPVDYPWDDSKPIDEFVKRKKLELYN
jgi:HTH-type transcriptional regulator / antitoxin HigA